MLCSPDDAEARDRKKRRTAWTGYRAHRTETCDDDGPHWIPEVHTTPAPGSDCAMLPTMQAALATREVLPAAPLVEAGDGTADHLVASQQAHGGAVWGPVNPDARWQAKAQQGFDVAAVVGDGDTHPVVCPHEPRGVLWQPTHDRHAHPIIHIRLARADGHACAIRAQCPQSATQPRRLTLRPRDQHDALQAARQRQTTEACKKK